MPRKKYLSWSIEATYLDGKKVKKDNLTVDFGLDDKIVKMVEDKLHETEQSQRLRIVNDLNAASKEGK
jgi:hypothetical protein